MREQDEQSRRLMGCGYLPEDPNAFPWQPNGRTLCPDEYDPDAPNKHGFTVPVCAGYACALPEVTEASYAHFFLSRGGLSQFTDGEPPGEALRMAVTVIESEQDKLMTHRQQEQERAAKRP